MCAQTPETEEKTLTTNDGETIYFRKLYCTSSSSPRAVITWVHGLGEHQGRYERFFEKIAKEGFIIHAFDHRGHGRSGGSRGHSPSYQQSLEDLDLIVQESQSSGLPHFLFGHSLGGGMVLRYALDNKEKTKKRIDGVIASAPFIDAAQPLPAVKKFFGQLFAPILSWVVVDNELDLNGLAKDPEVVSRYKADPFVHSKISLGLASGAIENGVSLLREASKFGTPLLLYHGDADRLTSYKASEQFFSKLTHDDKTFRTFEGGYHELHNDAEFEDVFKLVHDWLTNHS